MASTSDSGSLRTNRGTVVDEAGDVVAVEDTVVAVEDTVVVVIVVGVAEDVVAEEVRSLISS